VDFVIRNGPGLTPDRYDAKTVVDGCTLLLPLSAAPAWSVPGSVFPWHLVVHTLAALTLFVLPKGARDTAKAEMTHRGIEHLR
jgi:hypothetical protein